MKLELTTTEKLTNILSNGITIGGFVFAQLFKPEYIKLTTILVIVVLSVNVIYLGFRLAKQSRDLNNLKITLDNHEKKLSEQEAKIALIESYLNVPFFKKWHLIYSFMWRNNRDKLKNDAIIDEVTIRRKLHGSGNLKSNCATYTFKGTYKGKADFFSFCVAGVDGTTLEEIGFKATDVRNNESLDFSLSPETFDGNMKYIQIFFRQPKMSGDYFEITLEWDWPQTTYAKSDYFAIPNVYGIETKKIVTEFIPTNDMKIKNVEAYQYNIEADNTANSPRRIAHIYPDKNKHYMYTFEPLEQNADYIIYFE